MKKFILNKHHLHSLTFSIGLLFLHFTEIGGWTFGTGGDLFTRCFLTIFFGTFFAVLIEITQGFFGANKTDEEKEKAVKDAITSIFMSFLAVFAYLITPSKAIEFSLIVAVAIGVTEVVRQNWKMYK